MDKVFVYSIIVIIILMAVLFTVYNRKEPKKPDGFVLSNMTKDFPSTVCYSGTKSHLLELVPLAVGETNIVLIREWTFMPGNISKEFEEESIVIRNKFGEKAITFKPFKRGIYIYSPLIIGVIPYEGEVIAGSYTIKVPECFKNKKLPFLGDRKTTPIAVELSGGLDDLNGWLTTSTRRHLLEVLKLYENDEIRIFVARYNEFPLPGMTKNATTIFEIMDNENNVLLHSKIELKEVNNYHLKSNAIIIVLPKKTYILKIGFLSAKL